MPCENIFMNALIISKFKSNNTINAAIKKRRFFKVNYRQIIAIACCLLHIFYFLARCVQIQATKPIKTIINLWSRLDSTEHHNYLHVSSTKKKMFIFGQKIESLAQQTKTNIERVFFSNKSPHKDVKLKIWKFEVFLWFVLLERSTQFFFVLNINLKKHVVLSFFKSQVKISRRNRFSLFLFFY